MSQFGKKFRATSCGLPVFEGTVRILLRLVLRVEQAHPAIHALERLEDFRRVLSRHAALLRGLRSFGGLGCGILLAGLLLAGIRRLHLAGFLLLVRAVLRLRLRLVAFLAFLLVGLLLLAVFFLRAGIFLAVLLLRRLPVFLVLRILFLALLPVLGLLLLLALLALLVLARAVLLLLFVLLVFLVFEVESLDVLLPKEQPRATTRPSPSRQI